MRNPQMSLVVAGSFLHSFTMMAQEQAQRQLYASVHKQIGAIVDGNRPFGDITLTAEVTIEVNRPMVEVLVEAEQVKRAERAASDNDFDQMQERILRSLLGA